MVGGECPFGEVELGVADVDRARTYYQAAAFQGDHGFATRRFEGWIDSGAERDDDEDVPSLRAKESIRRAIRKRLPRLVECYNAGLGNDGQLAGSIEIRFVIERDGSIGSLRIVESDLDGKVGEKLGRCVAGELARISFVPSPQATVVVYPFNFSPKEPDG
ncbi:MAG: AgmX/PglI C-terminal domain-containing protein [Myxococcales bacterium FL481]|nr:MAG: AgmX/PglI C-terminal domain-containing protein [Myxococcales bacterium FL481]